MKTIHSGKIFLLALLAASFILVTKVRDERGAKNNAIVERQNINN